jgi:hypothetical protein
LWIYFFNAYPQMSENGNSASIRTMTRCLGA